jgi:hypothetical protein
VYAKSVAGMDACSVKDDSIVVRAHTTSCGARAVPDFVCLKFLSRRSVPDFVCIKNFI